MPMEYHSPVLLNESVNGLAIKKNGVYVDVTFGGGGHSRKIFWVAFNIASLSGFRFRHNAAKLRKKIIVDTTENKLAGIFANPNTLFY